MTETAELDPTDAPASPNGHVDWLDPSDEQQLRQFILLASDRPEEVVEVPLWRVKVLVRAMSGSQRVLYEALPRDQKTGRFKDMRHVYFEVVRMCCVHPSTHRPIFQPSDEAAVMDERNGTIISMLALKAIELSGILPSQTEQVRKNSESTSTSMTTTESQNDSATSQ